jgi:hypothetical protein
MTAEFLIGEIFSRAQGRQTDLRSVTERQFDTLRDLIALEPGMQVRQGSNGGIVWTPAGPYKYILTAFAGARRFSIMRLPNVGTRGAGSLFEAAS